jgi:hypothetical protein
VLELRKDISILSNVKGFIIIISYLKEYLLCNLIKRTEDTKEVENFRTIENRIRTEEDGQFGDASHARNAPGCGQSD